MRCPDGIFDAGPERRQRILTALIDHAMTQGQLRQASGTGATDRLTGLWIGVVTLENKLGVQPPLTPAEIQQRVARSVEIFLTFYSPGREK